MNMEHTFAFNIEAVFYNLIGKFNLYSNLLKNLQLSCPSFIAKIIDYFTDYWILQQSFKSHETVMTTWILIIIV